MRRWEYTSVHGLHGELAAILTRMGSEGWEAWNLNTTPHQSSATGRSWPGQVSVQFKRPIESDK